MWLHALFTVWLNASLITVNVVGSKVRCKEHLAVLRFEIRVIDELTFTVYV